MMKLNNIKLALAYCKAALFAVRQIVVSACKEHNTIKKLSSMPTNEDGLRKAIGAMKRYNDLACGKVEAE